jgi:DNA gyrase subunit A
MDVLDRPDSVRIVSVEEEMQASYMEYAMSVIVSRALPDVRDGLKPVHRRIVFGMEEGGYHHSKAYKKSARIVGDVMGKYHPHGDAAIYDTMVRMAQYWSMRETLIDGQGNFGSIDGDPPAAMRYTEARMSPYAHDLIKDLIAKEGDRAKGRDTVDFRATYDSSDYEPVVLPVRVPNLIINGSAGIAVGMATTIPTHNPVEAINATLMVLDNPNASIEQVMEIMPGPDFPTGGVIMGRGGIREAYATGRGSITVAGVAEIEEAKGGRVRIVVKELPYQVNKKRFQEKIADLVNEGRIEGVSDVRDESDREDLVRVVVDLKKGVDPNVVLVGLQKYTDLVTTFSYNAVCLDSRGRPVTMGIVQMLDEFIAFRRQVVRRRTIYQLDEARDALHKQIGLFAAISQVDEVIRRIRAAADTDAARIALMQMEFTTDGDFGRLIREADPDSNWGATFYLSEIQANVILSMQIRNLTRLESDKIAEKAMEFSKEIQRLLSILNSREILDGVIRNELLEVRARYQTDRLTRIEASEMDDIDEDALVERKDIVITVTNGGYIKRTLLDSLRAQKRGGKGRSGMETKDDDFVTRNLVCTTKTPLIIFTSRGKAHALRAYKLPEAAPNAKGRPIVNFVPLQPGETISAILPLPEDTSGYEGKSILFVTDFGTIRRNDASDFERIKKNGKNAIKLEDENGNIVGKLVDVLLCSNDADVLIASRLGQAVRFKVTDLRVMQSRDSTGVRAIDLADGDFVISASILRHTERDGDQRTAYMSGGEHVARNRVPRAEVANEAAGETDVGWGRIVTSYEEHEDGGDPWWVRRITLSADTMAEMAAEEETLVTISAKGYGKRSSAYDYRVIARGGKGVAAATINETTGDLVACFPVLPDDGLVLVTDGGQTIRTTVEDVSIIGRTGRGVRVFAVPDGNRIVGVSRVTADDVDTSVQDGDPV